MRQTSSQLEMLRELEPLGEKREMAAGSNQATVEVGLLSV